jgi:hypothetical protein
MKSFLPMIGGAWLVVFVGCSRGTSVGPAGKDSRHPDKTADTSKGESKIVGTWTFVRSSNNREPDWGTKLEFTPDGKMTMHAVGYANVGKYSLEGKMLTINATVTNKYTVVKLADKALVLEQPLAPPGNSATFEYRKR